MPHSASRRPAFVSALAILATALGAGAFAPQAARACSQLVPNTVQLVSFTLPSDGVLAGVLRDCDGCSAADIVVTDAAGTPVPGRLEPLPQSLVELHWFAFRPTTPWSVDARYTVRGPAKGTTSVGSTTFTIVAASSAALRAMVTLRPVSRGVSTGRCVEYDSSRLVGLCGLPTFFSDSVVEAQLGIMLAEPAATQHAYRVVWSADGQRVGDDSRYQPGQLFAHSFEGVPGEVCYELFAVPLTAAGTEQKLASECKRTDPSELGPRTASLGDVSGTLAHCLVPPAGYHDLWCRVLSPSNGWCTAPSPGGQACARARAECTDADAGAASGAAASDGGVRADAGAAGDAAHASDDEASPEEDAAADTDGGCSVHPSQRTHGSLSWLLSLLALGWLRRRGRKA